MRLPLGLILMTALVPAAGAAAQTDLQRFEKQLEQIRRDTRLSVDQNVPAEQRTLVDFGGYLTFNFFSIDSGPANGYNHVLRQTDLTGYGRVNIDGVHDFFFRAHTSYLDFNDGDSFDEHGDDTVEPTLDRATYRFDLARAFSAYDGKRIDGNIVLTGGRQLIHWANGVTLSEEIDGGLVDFSWKDITLEVVAGMTRDSITDIDSTRPGFDGDTHRGFYGAMLSYQVSPRHKPYVYGLVQVDQNSDETLIVGPTTTHFSYDSYYIGFGSEGSFTDRITYGIEAVYEGGQTLSSSTDDFGFPLDQTMDPISAWAFDAQLNYLFADTNRSRLIGEVLYATGDDDRQTSTTDTFGGNKPNTTDHAFNGFGLLNTGLAFAPSVSNLVMLRGGASTVPLPNTPLFRRMQVGTDLFGYFKADANAPSDEDTFRGESYLGFETDFYVNWRITSDLSLAVRYGVYFPGDALPDSEARQFVYTGLTLGF
ncbi:MAG: alginate export family protein [Planctomycetes bacterium]|nr:alginate export family protein [Planctomycetota bacterium]